MKETKSIIACAYPNTKIAIYSYISPASIYFHTSASHTGGWHIRRASYITEGHSVESLYVIIECIHCQCEGELCVSWNMACATISDLLIE